MTRYDAAHCILLTLLPITLNAQISDWEEGWKNLPTGSNGGVISHISENDMKNPIFNTWSSVLDDFKTDKDRKSEIDSAANDIGKSTANVKEIMFNGMKLLLPVTVDENGIDLFMLTDDGINIYTAVNPPSYYEDVDADTEKWIRFFAYTHRKKTEDMFRRYSTIEKQLKECLAEFGVPEDISLLCLVESGCTYDALSKAGALGLWQLMPETAREMGLVVNERKDERLNPVLSTAAAAKYLKTLYQKTGNWSLAIAAYNCGIGRVTRTVQETGMNAWYGVKNFLPQETKQYLPALCAIYYVWTYKKELGFERKNNIPR